MTEKLKRIIERMDALEVFDDIVTVLYVVLIMLPFFICFVRFVTGEITEGIFWAAVSLYWLIKMVTRSVVRDVEDDIIFEDDDDELHV